MFIYSKSDIIKFKNIDEIRDQAKSVILKPGMFSMHDVYLFHGSRANNSGKRRAGLTYIRCSLYSLASICKWWILADRT